MSEDEPKPPSKTQRKQVMHALQDLGEALVAFSAEQFASIDIPENLRDAVIEARRMTRHDEARRRQMQYIGRLMRGVDGAPIQEKIDEAEGRSHSATAALHRAERWRERLMEDDKAFTEFAREYPAADLQAVRACVREARKEREAQRPIRHFRDLFKLIRSIDDNTHESE